MKIFGREPAFYVGVIEAVIAILVTFQLEFLTQAQAGLTVAAVVAVGTVVSAWATQDTLLAALVGATKALLVLGVGYGAPLTEEQVGLISGLVLVVGSGWLRNQTSSLDTKVSKAS